MIGRVFGRLTVVELDRTDERFRKFFRCDCVCGGAKVVQHALLLSGNTKSCGCLAKAARAKLRLPNHAGAITAILLQYKRHARDRGIEFYLSREELDRIVRQPCHYCGNPAGNLKRTKNLPEGFPYNGIDRLDPGRPYTPENVVPCCGCCNRAKGVMTHDEFVNWAMKVADHQKEKGNVNSN